MKSNWQCLEYIEIAMPGGGTLRMYCDRNRGHKGMHHHDGIDPEAKVNGADVVWWRKYANDEPCDLAKFQRRRKD